jgi:hypothetical protein
LGACEIIEVLEFLMWRNLVRKQVLECETGKFVVFEATIQSVQACAYDFGSYDKVFIPVDCDLLSLMG